jgi:hypothetical protein
MNRLRTIVAGAALVVIACGGGGPATSPASATPTATVAVSATAEPSPFPPAATPLSGDALRAFAAFFDDQPFAGGQRAPLLAKWVNEDTFIWTQLDKGTDVNASTAVRYIGIGTRGVFCAEAMPDAQAKAFTRFQQWTAPDWEKGTGGKAGDQGYWMLAVATDTFEGPAGKVVPGVDYRWSSASAPSCAATAKPTFAAPGAAKLPQEKLSAFAKFFDGKPLIGGQTAPRLSKALNKDVWMLIQMDRNDPATATILNYIGLYERGVFCKSKRPSSDWSHYHRYVAATYGEGHGGQPGESLGYWLMWVATRPITDNQGRTVGPGPDRAFSLLTPPDC